MPTPPTIVGVFVDYDNLGPHHKSSGLLTVVTKALIRSPMGPATGPVKCEVRVYGGWYEGEQITRIGQDVTVALQSEFPTIIRLKDAAGVLMPISTQAALAVSMLEEPGHHLFGTYRRKGKPSNVRVATPSGIGCSDAGCILPNLKRLLKTGTCPKDGCVVDTPDLVYRNEQKLVDTMLTCDLVFAAGRYERVILVSGDDDFLPPLRILLLRGTPAVRLHPKPNDQRTVFAESTPKLIELDL